MESWHALIVERNLATDKHIKDDAETPHIDLRSSVSPSLEKLRRGKVQTTAKGLKVTSRCEEVTEAEVNNLNISGFADKNVFDLQVTVYNAVAVAIIECAGNLPAELARLLLFEFAVRDDVIQHLTAINKLEEHVPMVVRANYVAQAADMRVIKKRDNGSLTCRSDLLGLVGPLLIGAALVAIVGRSAGNDFASNLDVR